MLSFHVNPLPNLPILSSSNSAENKAMMSKILTNRNTKGSAQKSNSLGQMAH